MQKPEIEKCYVKLGNAIMTERLRAGMIQADLANKIKMSRPALANMEAGRQRIQLHSVFMIEKVLKCGKNYLINKARGK